MERTSAKDLLPDTMETTTRRLRLRFKEEASALKLSLPSYFHNLDKDASGDLDLGEFAAVAQQFGVLDDDELAALINSLDVDGSGSIDVGEFLDFVEGDDRRPEEAEQAAAALAQEQAAQQAQAAFKGGDSVKKSVIVFCQPGGDDYPTLLEVALTYLRSMCDQHLCQLTGIISNRQPLVLSSRIARWLVHVLNFDGEVQVGVGLCTERAGAAPDPRSTDFVTAFNRMNTGRDQSKAEFDRQLAFVLCSDQRSGVALKRKEAVLASSPRHCGGERGDASNVRRKIDGILGGAAVPAATQAAATLWWEQHATRFSVGDPPELKDQDMFMDSIMGGQLLIREQLEGCADRSMVGTYSSALPCADRAAWWVPTLVCCECACDDRSMAMALLTSTTDPSGGLSLSNGSL
jgi:hypothetical protein